MTRVGTAPKLGRVDDRTVEQKAVRGQAGVAKGALVGACAVTMRWSGESIRDV
jgi:hypothetical protein